MADFDVTVHSGATLTRWTDPIGPGGEPSRVRPHPGADQLFFLGKRGTPIVLYATPFGYSPIPPDSALGGRLFSAYLTEGFGPPLFVAAAGWSSVISWTPLNAGHHIVGIRRPSGGAVLVPFDIAS